MTVLIVVQTLRFGGIERNSLDQAYALSDVSIECNIFALDKYSNDKNTNFYESERALISEKGIKIEFANGNNFDIFKKLLWKLRHENIELVIDNTLKAGFFCFLIRFFLRKNFKIHSVIQQLASLSSPNQRKKRMFFAQFCDSLIINTSNYADDWLFHIHSHRIMKFIFRKKYKIIRNGIYLPRLPNLATTLNFRGNSGLRFIYLGRLKEWKGFENLKILDTHTNRSASFLLLVPSIDSIVASNLFNHFGERLEIVIGKTLDNFAPRSGDVHVYPVDYGTHFKFVESIATNCLEMAAVGVPSIVTGGGKSNWPELSTSLIVQFVFWNDLNSITTALRFLENLSIETAKFNQILKSISIFSNLKLHFQVAKNENFNRF